MSDAMAADDINTEYRDVNFPVGVATLEFAVRESLKWGEFTERKEAKEEATDTLANPNMREFMDIFFTTSSVGGAGTGLGGIDLQGPYVSGLLDRMVAEGSMGPAVAEAIRNFGVRTVSRGAELEIGTVSEGDVQYSRSLNPAKVSVPGQGGDPPPGQGGNPPGRQ